MWDKTLTLIGLGSICAFNCSLPAICMSFFFFGVLFQCAPLIFKFVSQNSVVFRMVFVSTCLGDENSLLKKTKVLKFWKVERSLSKTDLWEIMSTNNETSNNMEIQD